MSFYLKFSFKVSRSVSGCPSVSSSNKDQNDSRAQFFQTINNLCMSQCDWICVWGATEPNLPLFSLQLIHFLPSSSWVVCVCVSVCVYVRVGKSMRLLVGTLYSRAVVAALFVRAVIVSLPAVTRWRALADVIILQVDLLRVSTDDGWLWPWGQHVFQLLHRENNCQNTALTGNFIGISNHSLVSEGCGVKSAPVPGGGGQQSYIWTCYRSDS